MRPKVSQVVQTKGQYQDGRWTVVLRRPLNVNAQAGITLAPGSRYSVAFAVWDGAARDRNGQKLVSIWQDLQLEP
jgi:DMSO reductase family type II enzyme heme b subunit